MTLAKFHHSKLMAAQGPVLMTEFYRSGLEIDEKTTGAPANRMTDEDAAPSTSGLKAIRTKVPGRRGSGWPIISRPTRRPSCGLRLQTR